MSRDIQQCVDVLNRRAVEYGEKARKHEKTHGINTYRYGELNLYRKAYEDAAFAISKLKPPSPRRPMTPKQAVARCIEILNDAQHSSLDTLVCDVCFDDSAVYLMSKLEKFAATLSDDGEITDNTFFAYKSDLMIPEVGSE